MLLVLLTYKLPTAADSSPPVPASVEYTMVRLLGSLETIHAPTLVVSVRSDRSSAELGPVRPGFDAT